MTDECIQLRDQYASRYMRVFRGGRNLYVTRLIACMSFGKAYDDDTWVARHTCDNSCCIRVEHITVGTQKDNMRDRDTRQRTATGLRHGRAILSDDDVVAIRSDTRSLGEIAEAFGVSKPTISQIRSGKRR